MKNGYEMIQRVLNKLNKEGISMFELGDQVSLCKYFPTRTPAKNHFESMGIRHVSMDVNGYNGSLQRDITDDVSDLGQFDIITNLGTSEHVDSLEKQYLCFKNLHELCKVGGYIIHHVPVIGEWADHSPAHYNDDFFRVLKEKNSYDFEYYIYKLPDGLSGCIYHKKTDAPFVSKEEFPWDGIEWKEHLIIKF